MLGLGLGLGFGGRLQTVADLFVCRDGAWYDMSDPGLFYNGSFVTPVADADAVFTWIDKSPNLRSAGQVTASLQGIYRTAPGRVVLDGIDDNYLLSVPTGGWVGTMVMGTVEMTSVVDIAVPAGNYTLFPQVVTASPKSIVGIIVRNGRMTDGEVATAKAYLHSKGAAVNPSGSLYRYFHSRTDITALRDIGSTASVTSLSALINSSTNLTSLNISGWDLSLCTSIGYFAQGCTTLASVTVGSALSNTPNTNYINAFRDCALDVTSVDAILVGVNAANTSNGTLDIYGGTNATPSATGKAAADALRGRSWTVTLNGY